MQYQTPQFIEVEDKVFGPLTIKQFIYLAGGAGAAVVVLRIFGFMPGILFTLPLVALALALAFYKVNNKPFINVMESAIKYFFTNKLYIWKKSKPTYEKPEERKTAEAVVAASFTPKLSNSKLRELTWNLDIKNTNQNEENIRRQ